MRIKKRQLSLIISLALFAATLLTAHFQVPQTSPTATPQTPGLYKVDHDVDGDTIVVISGQTKETVRFIGVDTPETHKPNAPVQCFGPDAAAFTKSKVEGAAVRLETDPQSDNRDKYGRLLRYIYLADGTLLNKELVSDGYGFAITGFPFTKMTEFVDAGDAAHLQKRGLWQKCTVTNKGYPQTNPL